MKAIKTALALTMVLLSIATGGCMNLSIRPVSDYNNGPYYYTKMVGSMIDRGWNNRSVVARMFLPMLIADYPFDAIADTVMLPWDAITHHIRSKH